MSKILAAVSVLILAGCVTAPTAPSEQVLQRADYGPKPSTDEFNALAVKNLGPQLIDPSSLIFYGSTPLERDWVVDKSGKYYFGYLGCYDYNAKNQMGGYSGKKRHCLFIKNGVIEQLYTVSWINNGQPYLIPAPHTFNER